MTTANLATFQDPDLYARWKRRTSDALATHIRYVDGNNDMPVAKLGTAVAVFLEQEVTECGLLLQDMHATMIQQLVINLNSGRARLGAALLADEVVYHFEWDKLPTGQAHP